MLQATQYFSYFSITAFILSILLFIVYIMKDKVKKLENSVFTVLLLITIISIGVEILADFGIPRLNLSHVIILFIIYFYLYTNIAWAFTICCYALLISLKTEDKRKKYLKYRNVLLITFVASIITISFFNCNFYVDEEVKLMLYLTGPAVNVAFIISFVYIFLAVIFNISFFKKLKDSKTNRFDRKKVAPIIVIFAWAIFLGIVQIFNPEVTLLSFSEVIIVTIIYFFLENPDLELVDEIAKAKNTAEVANLSKTNFLSSMSHEIRTPLNAIVGLSEHIRTNNSINDKVREDIDDITVASNNLLEIIGNIIDINKIESDRLDVTEVKYVLEDELESLIRVVSTRLGNKPITLNINIDKEIPYELIGDKFHIKTIVNNLLTNAIKYTEKGYIEVNINASNVVPNDSCMLEIHVKDTGIGIKPENIKKLFSKFERLDFEGSKQIEGAGLGLSITKKIVDSMDGKIDVSSVYGMGSAFDVYVPQKISKMECELTNTQRIDIDAINARINSDMYNGKKILIVDDNKLNLKVAKKAVESFNFEIDECVNGEECLNKIIAGNHYDIILMDIMMPVMDGETAMKELKKIPTFTTPVIAVTADAIAGAKEKYLNDGFTDYIAKPFTKEQMKIKLDSIFRHSN